VKHFQPGTPPSDQASAPPAGPADPTARGQEAPPLPAAMPRRHSRLWLLPALLFFLLLAGFALFAGQGRARPDQPLRATDGIAVLTGGPERVEAGLRLLNAGYAQWLIVSGVGQKAELSDLSRLAGLSSQNDGVPRAAPPLPPMPPAIAERVTLGRVAASTRGNGMEVAEWARQHEIRSLRVVTAGYHMPRALLELRRNLPGVELVPHPVQAAGPRLALLTREYVKLLGAIAGLSALKP
jgi:uncharacterized SAM-binding protein YcdF (DUF218 family)